LGGLGGFFAITDLPQQFQYSWKVHLMILNAK
jgi:hypothetical protein